MTTYLYSKLSSEFEDTKKVYSELRNRWLDVWDTPVNHDLLYSLYVRLAVLAVLLRIGIDFKLFKNVDIRTSVPEKSVSLKNFCNAVIHRTCGSFTDNKSEIDGNIDRLKIYIELETDKYSKQGFDMDEVIAKIGSLIEKTKI